MQVFQDRCDSISELTGTLDINTVDELRGILLASLERNTTIVVDLSSVTSCDAAGVQLLFALAKSAELAGKTFALGATSEALVRDCAKLGIDLARSMDTYACSDKAPDLGGGKPAQGAKKSENLVGEMRDA